VRRLVAIWPVRVDEQCPAVVYHQRHDNRLSADQADELETVAAVDDQPVSEVIRAAITAHIAQGKQDEDFQQGLRVAQDLP